MASRWARLWFQSWLAKTGMGCRAALAMTGARDAGMDCHAALAMTGTQGIDCRALLAMTAWSAWAWGAGLPGGHWRWWRVAVMGLSGPGGDVVVRLGGVACAENQHQIGF